MKPELSLEFGEIFCGADDAEANEVSANVPDVFGKFFENAELAGAIGLGKYGQQHVSALREELAPLNARFAALHADAKSAGSQRLEKSARRAIVAGDANDARQIARRSVTEYSDGSKLIAEIAEGGGVIRVIKETA